MKKVELNLENCYGIKKLQDTIEFTKLNRQTGIQEDINACLIYASNGTMKTSFANTFLDIENDRDTIDRIEPNNNTIREIKIDGKNINKEDILVIQTYVEGYDSNNKSKLLASKKLKKEYDDIWNEISKNKDAFLKEIKKISGINNINEIEKEIIDVFKENNTEDFLTILEKIKQKYIIEEIEILKNIKYKELVNDDIENVLSQEVVSNALGDYMKKYNEILEQSEIYKPGIFDNTRAMISLKSLKDNNFFEANHKILLENQTVLNETEFEDKMQEVEDKILTDEEIKKNFKIIEIALGKKVGLRKFKDLLYKNQKLIPLLKDYSNLKKMIWLNYFAYNIDIFNILVNLYTKNKERLKEIIKEAKSESTIWEEVTNVFNDRFSVPFRIEVANQEDVILKEESLILNFVYQTGTAEKEVNREKLEDCLSNGEKKALYILNILYELKAKELEGKEYLVILDDIADSFDYKNKYAIIEYLNNIIEKSVFKLIILTHNFDFYRSVSSRLNLNSNNFFAIKHDNEIVLKKGQYTKNVFMTWKSKINEPKIFISSIAFIRNIIEYIAGQSDKDYKLLTNLLHYKEIVKDQIKDTNSIVVSDIISIFTNYWHISNQQITITKNKKMVDLIFDTANDITQETTVNEVLLENKIVLSIAIRLKAEIYMINKINNKNVTDNIDSNQTRELMNNMDFSVTNGKEIKTILEEVLIMTSENIHINSFMYEPIIDMSLEYLIKLYNKVCNLK